MTAVPRPLFVAIVHESPVVVLGLTALLRPFGRRVRIAAYDSRLPQQGRADVVLYDPFGESNTVRRIDEIAQETGALVLAYSWQADQARIDDAIKAGAAGFLSKTTDGAATMEAIERIATSRTSESAPTPEELTIAAWPGEREGLSAREAAIVSLMVVGLSNQDIASSLYMSMHAVKTHIRSAYSKMGVTSRTEAIAWGAHHRFEIAAPTAPANSGVQR